MHVRLEASLLFGFGSLRVRWIKTIIDEVITLDLTLKSGQLGGNFGMSKTHHQSPGHRLNARHAPVHDVFPLGFHLISINDAPRVKHTVHGSFNPFNILFVRDRIGRIRHSLEMVAARLVGSELRHVAEMELKSQRLRCGVLGINAHPEGRASVRS